MTVQSSFWARRKAAVAAEQEAEARAEAVAEQEARAAELCEKDDAEILAEMGLPDPEKMKSGDDFTGFLSREVPEHLRRRALRSLWRSNPVLACVDGLNDYDDDYRVASGAAAAVKTAYQVGKGMTYHIEEMARQAEKKAQDALQLDDEAPEAVAFAPDAAADGSYTPTEAAPEPHNMSHDVAATDDVPAMDDADSNEDALAEMPRPHRMRFRFEGTSA